MGGGSGGGRGVQMAPPPFKANPSHIKYRAYTEGDVPNADVRKTATQHVRDLANPPSDLTGHRPTPEIIEFLNIHDHTHQVISKVDVETPLFQPFPPELGFHHYEPNKTYEQILWFRNNDYVPRRIKIEPPSGGTFSVKRMRGKRGEKLREEPEDAGRKSGPTRNGRPNADPGIGKVAPGMEVAFKVRFVPVDTEDYLCDLVVATERERFVVPIKCVGNKPALDFPDLVAFESTPAKCSSVATRVVRNVGTKRASFAFHVPDPFAAFPSEGELDIGEAMQIRLEFHPERCGAYEAEMEIDCGEGVAPATVRLIGDGCEMRVGLDCGEVEMLPTFVRKRTRRTFRVVNRGDRVSRFEVKRLADAFLDEEARLRATRAFSSAAGDPTGGLDGETLDDARPALHLHDDASSSSSYDSADEDDILGAEAVAFATRRKGLDRALGADALLFEHAAFSVSPLRGEVQPGCEFEVTVTFHPDDAGETFATCFVDVEGREDRLPLAFRGQAVGPLAVFNYDALEVGDVFVGAVHQYEVELVNRGEIECEFEYRGDDRGEQSDAGRVFSFEPARGALGVGQSCTITVTLCSETLGPFDETFEFFVEGGERNAYLDFRGRVVGPKFAFADVDAAAGLDFGVAALGFRMTKSFALKNACEIPMRFALRVPGADKTRPEFSLLPCAGTILPFGQQRIEAEFVPSQERRYVEQVLLDIPGVGDAMARLPLRAESRVAELTTSPKTLAFGEVFLEHEETRVVTVRNTSRVPAKFSVPAQDALTTQLASWTATPDSGTLAAMAETEVVVTLRAHHLGIIRVPLSVVSVGSKRPPTEVALEAAARGPLVRFFQNLDAAMDELSAKAANAETLRDPLTGDVSAATLVSTSDCGTERPNGFRVRFGKVGVLRDAYRSVFARNDGPVPAELRAFTRDGEPAFEVDAASRDATLQPGEICEIVVRAHMDQTLAHRDALCVMVTEGGTTVFPLEAEGVGSLVTCEDLGGDGAPDVVAFGAQLKDRPFSREIVVTNNSRVIQQLVWKNVTAEEKRRAAVADAREYLAMISPSGAHKDFRTDKTDGEMGIVFFVEPERVSVHPKTSVAFTLTGVSELEGEILETLTCVNTNGAPHERGEVMTVHATASVTVPLLEFSRTEMGFEYSHDPDVDSDLVPRTETRPLTFRNVSRTPVTFALRCDPPFSVDRELWSLEHEEAGTALVRFDPEYRGDRKSHEVRTSLRVEYVDVPAVDEVFLGAEVRFPNLAVDATEVRFGATLNDTTERRFFTLRNDGDVPAKYEWVFDVPEEEEEEEEGDLSRLDETVTETVTGLEIAAERSSMTLVSAEASTSSVASRRVARSERAARRARLLRATEKNMDPSRASSSCYAPEEVLDVRPIRGVLHPGESEVVELSYFAKTGSEVRAFAVCEVHGGPSYDVAVTGEARELAFELGPRVLDVGRTQFDRAVDTRVVIENKGKVGFDFKVNLERLTRPTVAAVEPTRGRVEGGEKVTVTVRVRPGAPEALDETIEFSCAHFEPIEVFLRGEGTYHALGLSLPRVEDGDTAELLARAEAKLRRDGPDPDLPERFRDAWVEAPDFYAVSGGDANSASAIKNAVDDTSSAIDVLDPSALERLREESKLRAKAIAAPPPRLSEARKALGVALTARPEPPKPPRPGFGSATSTGRGVRDFMKARVAQRERLKAARVSSAVPSERSVPPREDEDAETLKDAEKDADASRDAPAFRDPLDDDLDGVPTEEPSRTFEDVELEDGAASAYEPTRFETAHEADRARMRDALLRRERERERRAAERLASGADADVSGRDEARPPLYPRPPGSAPGGARRAVVDEIKTGAFSSRAATPSFSSRRAATSGGVGSGGLDGRDDSYVLGPDHRHVALGLPAKLPATQAHYLVDFGHVALGGAYRRRFRVQNLGAEHAVFAFDKAALHSGGFDVFPEQMPKLAGAPFHAYVDCDVVFDTNKGVVRGGEVCLDAPLTIKGAPRVVLRLTAVVDTPRVATSSDALDFGDVKVGHRLTKYVQLHNDGRVPCAWSVVKPARRAGTGNEKEKEKGEPEPFRFVPGRGVLQPGERVNVKAHFAPLSESGDEPFARQHAIRVEHNPELRFVSCRGAGRLADVRCDHPGGAGPLEMGVIVPTPEGGEGDDAAAAADATDADDADAAADPPAPSPPRSAEREVWLVNDTAVDVEVYAVDFDARFAADELALRHAEGLKGRPEGAKLFLPPRAAGDGLWAHIQEAEDARLAAEAAAAAAAEAEAAYQALVAEALEKGEEPPPRPEPEPEVDEAAAENAEGEDAGDPPPPPPPESDGSRNVLVTGAPFAMAAETATRAAEKYGVAPLDVDAVVREAAATAGELGDLVRAELGVSAPEAAEEARNDAETSPATESAAAPADAEEPLVDAPADAPEEDDFPEELESDAPEEGTLKISTLARVLSAALRTRDEWKGGFVIGGLAWETASPATLVKALRRALGMRKAAPAAALPPADTDPDAWEAPAEEEGAFALHSAKRLTVISLAIEDDAAGAREKRAKEEEARALLETAAEDGEVTETTPEDPERSDERSEPDSTPYVYERAEDAAKHRELLETLWPLLGSMTASNQHALRVTVDAGAFPEDADALLDAAVAAGAPEPPKPPDWIPPDELCEIVTARAARADREPVTAFQILTPTVQPERPGGGGAREASKDDAAAAAEAEEKDDAGKDDAEGADDGDGDDVEPSETAAETSTVPEMLAQTRWVIPAGGATMVLVRFASDAAGDFDKELAFECVGGARVETLRVTGRCEYPRVASDPLVAYGAARVVKSRPEEHAVRGVFVKSSGTFEFGPLVNNLPEPAEETKNDEGDDAANEETAGETGETAETGEGAEDALLAPKLPPGNLKKKKKPTDPPNVARVTMLNPSAFPCVVKLEARAPDDPESGEPGGEQDTFAVFPASMTLAPGESREAKVTAYPKGDLPEAAAADADLEETPRDAPELARAKRLGVKRGIIAAIVEGNPEPTTFAVSCVPAAPRVSVDFYPEKTALRKRAAEARASAAAAAALAAAAEKKRARVLGVEAKRKAEAAKTKPPRRKKKADGEADEETSAEDVSAAAAEETAPEETEETDAKGEEAPAETTSPAEDDGGEEEEPPGEPGVFFGRRLCDETKAERTIVVRNDSLVPARWTLVPPEEAPPACLAVDASSGVLAPGEETSVSFAFGSTEPEEVSALFTLRVFDEGGAFADAPTQVTEIKVEGETWKIDVDVAFPDAPAAAEAEGEGAEAEASAEGEGAPPPLGDAETPKKERVDFGLMKSTETATRRIVLTNNGKYAARFDFELRRLAKEVFSVEPSSGELEPGAAAECAVVFDVSKTSDPNARRAKLVDAPDIVLTVAELEPAEEQSQSALALASARTKKARDAASLLEKTEAARRAREKRRASKRVVVHASVDASFAEYALTPRRGVDFGPHLPGAEFEEVGARFFDVTNHGAFPFEVFAFDYGGREGDDGGAGGEVVLDERGVPAPPPKPEGESLSLGAFVVSPVSGVVEPGSKLSFEVRFAPSDDRAFSELLGLHVADRDPRDQPLGIPYKLHGESVAPGVDAGEAAVAGVFEEHEVIERELDVYLEGKTFLPVGPRRAVSAVYSRRDGAFGFGAVTAEMEASGDGSDADAEAAAKTNAEGDGEDAETRDADAAGDSSAAPPETPPPLPARAVTANFKISNPRRVKCVVDVALNPVSGDESGVPFPMALLPGSETLVIEPREHAFVSVVFAPRALQKYAAALTATVRDGARDASSVTFELRGEGALPHVAVASPAFLDPETGAPTVRFTRVAAGSKKEKKIVLRNDGALVAYARVDVSDAKIGAASGGGGRRRLSASPFVVVGAGVTHEIKPGHVKALRVLYEPREVSSTETETERKDVLDLTLAVRENPFETRAVRVVGEAFAPDVVFEHLPRRGGVRDARTRALVTVNDDDDVSDSDVDDSDANALRFEDGPVGTTRTATFSMTNVSAKPWRFEWPAGEEDADADDGAESRAKTFAFSPRVGHLPPGTSTQITVSFAPTEPCAHGLDAEHPPLEMLVKLAPVKAYYEGSHDAFRALKDDAEADAAAAEADADATPAAAAAPLPPRLLRAPRWTDQSFEERYVVETDVPDSERDPVRGIDPTVHPNVRRAPRRVKRRFATPEPAHELDARFARTEPLRVTAVAADASFEMDTGPIAFKPTLMFQARTHAVTLRNTGMANLPFECDVFDPKQERDARDEKIYSVAPSSGVVAPGGAVELVVRFAPEEVYASCSRTLRVCFPGASADGARETTVPLDGKALRPWCHFDLAESDYLTSGRRPAGEGSSLPEVSGATKVVQFASLGLGARVARRFEVLNPTSEAYEFFWEKTSNGSSVESERESSPFRCLTPRGVVAPGKRYEMAFEYAPAEGDAHERAFTFRAPSVGVSVPFLLAGSVTEPRVTLDTACVNFGKCLVGATRRESVTLANHERVPFKYAFDAIAPTNGARGEVTFDPPFGTIGPLGEVTVSVAYRPANEGSRSVNVALRVDRKPTAIRLNVKAEAFTIREACALEPAADLGPVALGSAALVGRRQNIALAPAPARNAVSLGRVCVDDVATRRVVIANEGELAFEAEWILGATSKALSVSPEHFSVAPGERRTCEISYRPTRTETLRESDAILSVVNGRSYAFVIEADARKPALAFSARDVVFGPALVIEKQPTFFANDDGVAPEKRNENARVLTLTNQDTSPLTVDCAFDSSGDDDAGAFVLVSGFPGSSLKPGASCEFVFAFHPREPRKYETYVPFEVNGVSSTRVRVSGEGVAPRLELLRNKPSREGSGSKTLDFGSARAGSAIVKELTLVNKCRLPVEVAVDAETLRAMLDADVRCAAAVDGGSARTLAAPPPETAEKADDAIVDGDPKQTALKSQSVVVPARKTVTYKLTFAPAKRSRPFQVPFAVSVAGGSPKAVSLLVGGCVGAELALSRDAVDFGAVVDGARVTKTVLLRNTGDVGCSFAFDVASALVGDKAHLRKRFELFPRSGYVGPGADQEIRATFVAGFPPGQDAREKETENGDERAFSVNYDFVAQCVLDDGADSPLELSVLARCVTASAPTDTVRFSARARGETVVETVVRNSTNEAWRLAPTIANGNWRGAETLFVPARGEASYAITYAPLSVSTEEDPHLGSVRFELPDGTVDTRELVGVADAPEIAGVVEASVPAKKSATVAVPLKNFVKSRRQRFRATVTFSEDDSASREAVTLRGPEFVEVAANGARSYPLSFYGFKEGETTRASVTFADVDTNEVATYDVAVTTTAPETQGEISLRAAARQKVIARVPVTNPLPVPVDVTTRFSNPRTFAVDGETTTIPAKTTADVRVGYRPVVAETTFSDVVVESDALGAWPFRLALSATAAGPERGVSFTVPLGSAETKKVTFAHFLDEPAAYDVRWRGGGGNGAFVSAATHQAQAASGPEKDEGLEQSLDVTFEPMSLGSQFRDVLLITSETGGEYVVPVSGRCVAPKPVGPIVVGAAGASVSFKNPFDAETTFVCATDNPAFVVTRSETIGAKQTKAIGVRYEPSDAGRGATAKLLVTSDRVPGAPWAFYLKAERA